MSDQGVPVRLAKRPVLTESAVGTAPPTPTAGGQDTVKITIDGKEISAEAGSWLIQAADDAGIYIPRFCYHPRMKPVGMCRMCLVEVEGPRGSTLMPACYNPVADGMVVHTASEMAKKAQEGVLEFLLVNHPLDCPVCDKGGECPLQDQTLAYGPGETRFVEEKRHWEKPIAISELVYLDRERCIQCGRCVRFADEVAGDPLIDFAERGDMTEVATFPGEPYSSYFSGNVVQICPVGALTAKPYRFKARPWDLQQVESTCTTCAVGCRTAVQSSSAELTRLIGVDSDPVNWGWLCDKGRFVFEAGTAANRLSVPMVRQGNELVEASWGEALAAAAAVLSSAKAASGGRSIALIGGARLPNEDAYAWSKLARVAFGTDNVDAQIGDGIPAETVLGVPRATIDQACAAPLVITIGPDIKEELPVLYLRLRDAVREKGTQLVELAPAPTGMTRYTTESAIHRPGELAALAAAITAASPVTGDVAGVSLETIRSIRSHIERSGQMAPAGRPSTVVILGRPSLGEPADQVSAAARILADLPGVAFLSGLRRGNVHGALDMGLAPGVLPGRVSLEDGREWFEYHWGAELPTWRGEGTPAILNSAARGRVAALVLLGADPLADFPDSGAALRGLLGARSVIAVDTHLNESVRRADVVLPAAGWAERRGTFTNLEGRITWLSQLVTDHGVAWPDWMIATELAGRLGVDLGFSTLEEIWEDIASVSPLHAAVGRDRLVGPRARDGLVVPIDARAPEGGRPPRPLDPMADPGIASAELHKVAPTALMISGVALIPEPVESNTSGIVAEPEGSTVGTEDSSVGTEDSSVGTEHSSVGTEHSSVGTEDSSVGTEEIPADPQDSSADAPPPSPPPPLGLPSIPPPAQSSPTGSGLRLVSRRVMWDGGTQVQSVPALAKLSPEAALRVHPSVLAALGVADGETIRVRSNRGSLDLPGRGDLAVPPGTAFLPWNLSGVPAGALIDASAAVTEVHVESIHGGGDSHG